MEDSPTGYLDNSNEHFDSQVITETPVKEYGPIMGFPEHRQPAINADYGASEAVQGGHSFYPEFSGETAFSCGQQSLSYPAAGDSFGTEKSVLGVGTIPPDYLLQPIGMSYLQGGSYDAANHPMIPAAIQLQPVRLPPAMAFGQTVNANATEGICQQ